MNPVIARILELNPWGTPNRPLPLCDDSGDPNLFVTTKASNDVDSFIGKIDHSFDENNQITGRYYYGNSDQSFPLAILGGNILPGYNTVTPTRVDLVSLSYLKIFSSTKVNEVRFGYNRFKQGFFPEDQAFDPRSIGLNTGVTNPRDFGLPFIRISNDAIGNIASIGSNLSLARARVDKNIHFIDNLSWKINAHDTKMGYEFRRTDVNAFFDAGYRGRLDFNTLDDFLTGTFPFCDPDDPTAGYCGGRSAQGESQRQTFQSSHTFYFQDNWRAAA